MPRWPVASACARYCACRRAADGCRTCRARRGRLCAVEIIHVYSLVHDDMPAMDNNALRHGKPTVHVQYDAATALLVGDALQSQAFATLAHAPVGAATRVALLRDLAQASGSFGMAGGHAINLESVGIKLDRAALEQMHRMKTGALLRAAVRLGALCGIEAPNGSDARASQPISQPVALPAPLDTFASAVGLVFQVVDDILDATADTHTLARLSRIVRGQEFHQPVDAAAGDLLGKLLAVDLDQPGTQHTDVVDFPAARCLAQAIANFHIVAIVQHVRLHHRIGGAGHGVEGLVLKFHVLVAHLHQLRRIDAHQQGLELLEQLLLLRWRGILPRAADRQPGSVLEVRIRQEFLLNDLRDAAQIAAARGGVSLDAGDHALNHMLDQCIRRFFVDGLRRSAGDGEYRRHHDWCETPSFDFHA